MTTATLLRLIGREARGARGRVIFFVLCLAVGVGAVVAVAGFSASLRATLAREARQMLAADLRVRGQKPVPPAVDELLAADPDWQGVRSTRLIEMVTVAAAPPKSAGAGRSQLVELKAVDGEFPFYGTLTLSPEQLARRSACRRRRGRCARAPVAPRAAHRRPDRRRWQALHPARHGACGA